jgi:hypothetical protein
MAIYGRVGQRVVIQRLGTLNDVRELDKRKPDKQDREAVKLHAYVVVSESDYRLRLYHVAFLRADDGAREIGAVVDACLANGGRAP